MRRLLMLALVLALSSAGYATVATLDITVDGQPYRTGQWLLGSEIIKVVWNTTDPVMGGYAGVNFDVSLGDYVADSFSTLGAPPFIGTDFHPEDTGDGMAIIGGSAGMPHLAGWTFEFEFHVPVGIPVFTIIVLDTLRGGYGGSHAVPGPGDGFPYAELGIPEPMTIALLGLGGLFLRRRK